MCYKILSKELNGKSIENKFQKCPQRLPKSSPILSQSGPKVVPKPALAAKGAPKGSRNPKILKNVIPPTPKFNKNNAKILTNTLKFYVQRASKKQIYKYPAISHSQYKDLLCTLHGISAILHSNLHCQKLSGFAASEGRR